MQLKNWLYRNRLYAAGTITGAIVGFFYWKLIGCSSGTCAITSKPINSTIYFAMVGALVFGLFKNEKKTAGRR
jgi:hypothetical protein